MAYRGGDAGNILEAETADGALAVTLGANQITVAVGTRSLHLADRVATIGEEAGAFKKSRRSLAIAGIVLARGVPREDLGVWVEAVDDRSSDELRARRAARGAAADRSRRGAAPSAEDVRKSTRATSAARTRAATRTTAAALPPRASLRRIFGASPPSLLDAGGLRALARLDAVSLRLRVALADYAAAVGIWSARAFEIGSGHVLDKVLFADYGDRHAIYARKLFRDRARLVAEIHRTGRVVVHGGKAPREVAVTSRYGVTVRGDYIRFADRHGTDRARIAVPWLTPEDRDELAHRIGQLVHRG